MAKGDIDRGRLLPSFEDHWGGVTRLATWAVLPAFALLTLGCAAGGGTGTGPALPTADNEQQSSCRAAKDPMNPLIVEWPATAKTTLDAAAQRGIVVVSYQGCTMKVLDRCDAGGGYKATQLSQANSENIVIDSEDKLFAELPMGVASLRGRIKRGQKLLLDYTAVGRRTADGEPLALQGSCAGATHYVQAMTVGAYALMVSGSQEIGAGAKAFGASAGGETKGSEQRIHGSGDPKVCRENPESPTCGAILQLTLSELPRRAEEPSRAGFASGLGRMAPLPTVGKIRELEATGLGQVDAELLEAMQRALKFEQDKEVLAEQRRNAWKQVADRTSHNPYREQALERMHAWELVAEGEARYAVKAQRVCHQEKEDKAKLDRLLAIDEKLLSAQKKAALKSEYDRAYTPFKDILAECETWDKRATEGWIPTALARAKARDEKDAEDKELRQAAAVKAKRVAAREAYEAETSQVRLWKTVAMMGGGVLVVGGGVLVGAGGDWAAKATKSCSGTACPPSANPNYSDAILLGNAGVATFLVGAAALAGGIFWPVPAPDPLVTAGKWQVVPGPGELGVGVGTGF